MSIKLEFSKGSLRTEVSLRDEALGELMQLFAKYETSSSIGVPTATKHSVSPPSTLSRDSNVYGDDQISRVKIWLTKHTASEALNLLKWQTHPDRILLLGAFHESNGGSEGWKSSDIQERYDQAKVTFPKNFPRDIKATVEEGVIGAVTSRTYRVGLTGWNKIGEAIETTGRKPS